MPRWSRKKSNLLFLSILVVVFAAIELTTDSNLPALESETVKQILGVVDQPSSVQQGETENATKVEPKKTTATVIRVIDGDTIEIEGGQRVRYIGINTPESKDPNRPVECFSLEATAKNQELVGGKEIQLEKDVSETDRYGRLLRYVYVDGAMVNETLVKEGFAQASAYPPDIKHQAIFTQAEREAREQQRGLWGAVCSPTVSADTL